MRTLKTLLIVAAALFAAVSCSEKAKISGVIPDVDTLIVKTWTGTTLKTLDTLALKGGKFATKVTIKAGDPRYVYLYTGEDILTSLTVVKGDNITITGQGANQLEIKGSEASLEHNRLVVESAAAKASLLAISSSLSDNSTAAERRAVASQFNRRFIEYYRERVKFLMANPCSINSYAVLNEDLGSIPVFSRAEDALYFKQVADSLISHYPDSRYANLLKKDADARCAALSIQSRLSAADEIGFPEIRLPGLDGTNVSLTDFAAGNKMTIVYFWASEIPANNVFNTDYFQAVYKKYAKKGLGVYAVSLDTDKSLWARACADQKLDWVNVCDGLGAYSNVLLLYNVRSIPTVYFIYNGTFIADQAETLADVEKILAKYLK